MSSANSKAMAIRIRSATPGDGRDISALVTQLGYDVAAHEIAARIAAFDDRRIVFVADDDGRIIGWAGASVDTTLVDGFHACIEGFVVDEAVRSRGIGLALLEAIERWARERECSSMIVRSNVVRARAHDFYRRHDYQVVKSQQFFRKVLR